MVHDKNLLSGIFSEMHDFIPHRKSGKHYHRSLIQLCRIGQGNGKAGRSDIGLKDIRARAGIEPGDDGMYGLPTGMSREELREAILHEKYIEMAFEGKIFWDLRRHRMLNKLDGMRKYGVMAMEVNGGTYNMVTPEDINAANNYERLPEDFTYEFVELIANGPKQMSMPESYYFFPIQLTHIDKNPNLEQNEGWEGGTFDPTL